MVIKGTTELSLLLTLASVHHYQHYVFFFFVTYTTLGRTLCGKAASYINSPKKMKIHRVDSGEHWPTSIKEIFQWFNFLTIMEHTANNTKKTMG